MSDLKILSSLPMLPRVKGWLKDCGPEMEELLTDIAYGRSRSRALESVWGALEGGVPDSRAPVDDVEAEIHLAAHVLSRILVAAVGEAHLVSRFAVWESKRASKVLERAPPEIVLEAAGGLGVDVEGGFRMGFSEYLVHSPNEKAWHLVKRDVQGGVVELSQEDFARLLEEVYRKRIEEGLSDKSKNVPTQVHEVFESDISNLREAVKERMAKRDEDAMSEVEPSIFPPCMSRILQDMHEHKNVPHMGRFAIVSFLHHLEMDTDGILEFFSSVPDFDPEKSRYQIEHITGKGSPEAYKPPGCAAMQSYGVCPLQDRDRLCAKVKHPLSYYRKSLWRQKKEAEA